MRLRHAVVGGGIVFRALYRPELATTGDAAPEFFPRFLADRFFELIRAAGEGERACREEQGGEAFHPRRLKAAKFIAKENARRGARRVGSFAVDEPARNVRIREVIEPEVLLQGYRLGIFPMAMADGRIEWFSPNPRGVLPLEDFHVPHGLRRAQRKGRFEIRVNTAFAEVMRECAARDDTWIDGNIVESYIRLHQLGHAHSVEAWCDGELAGGLYGVSVGGAFFGESMFHRVTDASKIALVALVERLRERRFTLLDTQWSTEHLEQFGVLEIPRRHYLRLLAEAAQLPRDFA